MYSVVAIRNMFKLNHLAVVDAVKSGYVTVTVKGNGETLDSYYTDRNGLNYLKRLSNKGNVAWMVVGCSVPSAKINH